MKIPYIPFFRGDTRMHKQLLSSVLLCAVVLPAAGMDCGDPPPVANESLRGSIAGEARLLTRLIGGVDISGDISRSREEIFSRYPDANRGRTDAFFLYQICMYLQQDDLLTNSQKIRKLMEIRREFLNVSSSEAPPRSEQEYPVIVLGVDFVCNVDLPSVGPDVDIPSMPSTVMQILALRATTRFLSESLVERGEAYKPYTCKVRESDDYVELWVRRRFKDEDGRSCALLQQQANDPDWTYAKTCCQHTDGSLPCVRY